MSWTLLRCKGPFKESTWRGSSLNGAETLVWPDAEHVWGDDLTGQMIMRWGVSWFELYVNFLICTGQYCPVRVSGSIDKAQYVDYSSDLARVLPSDKRSATDDAVHHLPGRL